MARLDRKWMYERLDGKNLRREFIDGVEEFIDFSSLHQDFLDTATIRCPCYKCKNLRFLDVENVKLHLYKKGFCDNYFKWLCHGENSSVVEPHENVANRYREMVVDALCSGDNDGVFGKVNEDIEEDPNPQAKQLLEMLKAAEEPLYKGSKTSLLKMATRLTNLKCEYNLPNRCVDGIASFLQESIPENNLMTTTFYDTKKILKALELPHVKIHACPEGCMLFWKDDTVLDKCKKCGRDRYKKTSKGNRIPAKVLVYFPITPRLQRLYVTKNIAEQMRWHAENPRVNGTLAHPSDGEAWKHFDDTYPDFAAEPRNVRLGLCADGFLPHGKFGRAYSSWPVILTPYNLPPWLCMKRQFMFLSLIVPGPKNPKEKLDVYMQPLIEELKQLWEDGAVTYDVSKKQNFTMKAAIIWTVSDFPAYGMLSGWSTAPGKYSCPYCMEKTRSFRLRHGNKMCWFDCHRQFLPKDHAYRKNRTAFYKNRVEKRTSPPRLTGHQVWERVSNIPKAIDPNSDIKKSKKDNKSKEVLKGWNWQSIFWDLPYWKDLLIRHNLDVMHIEKNFFDQLIHTIMDVKGHTCDSITTRKDLPFHCKRRNLEVFEDARGRESMPKASFSLDKTQRKVLCEWLKNLKFPDGYASDIGRCVDLQALKLSGMKSHDCHVFMERLVPVAFRHLLPAHVWKAITEISQFFRDLCSSTIKVDDMIRLEHNIPEILCKLEKIFPPAFFNYMEHLPVHLPYEAKVGGPVQYRWMYPFERFLNHLKKKVGNKARVEGSICNAYLTEEISNFCANYFESHIDTKSRDMSRNVRINVEEPIDLSVPQPFRNNSGCARSVDRTRFLLDPEYERAHLYVLSNCEILGDYERMFEEYICELHPHTKSGDIWSTYEEYFPEWFKKYVISLNINDDVIRALALGPSRRVKTWRHYFVNGFNFHTYEYGKNKATMNYGVSVRSLDEMEYYGILDEVLELSYVGNQSVYKAILFKCNWMDSINGINVHEHYKIVDVNHMKKYPKYDPFVLAYQVKQVYFAPYPSLKTDRNQWWVVFHTKARSSVDAPIDESFFQEEVVRDPPVLLSRVDQHDSEENQEDEFDIEDDNMEEDEDEDEEDEDEDEDEEDEDEEEEEEFSEEDDSDEFEEFAENDDDGSNSNVDINVDDEMDEYG